MFMMLQKFLQQRMDIAKPPTFAFAMFGIVNYPLFYFYWTQLTPQAYTNASLRAVAIILCIGVALRNAWPNKLQKYFPIYWFFSILFCLPFFATFMLIMNQGSTMWLMNVMLILFLMILLVDWLMFSILISLGTVLAFIAHYLIFHENFAFVATDQFMGAMSTYVWAIVIGIVFSKNSQQMQAIAKLNEQLQQMTVLASSIAHELRTPLGAIRFAANFSKDLISKLIKHHNLARQQGVMGVENIPERKIVALDTRMDSVLHNVAISNSTIDISLTNLRSGENIEKSSFSLLSMSSLVNKTLDNYPFAGNERSLIHIVGELNFKFKGDELLMINILNNLIKNSIYYIRDAGKGEISLWAIKGEQHHTLFFKDTGKGITNHEAKKIFELFYSKRRGGTGLGLTYCKKIMKAFGGDIKAEGKAGEFTQFTLTFPAAN